MLIEHHWQYLNRNSHFRGITAIRITPFGPDFASQRHDVMLADTVARVGELREAVGSGVDIGVEIHRRLSPTDAIVLAAELEQYRSSLVVR